MRHQRVLAAAAVALGLVLTGCGDATDGSNGSTSATTKDFNKTDVAFAQQMIPHHRQAVEMAELAETRASQAKVKQLAVKIEGAQAPEIKTMTGWLKDWDQKNSGMSHEGSDHEGKDHGDMGGMMSAEDMARLKGLTGAAFDREFLTMMIGHHSGAIEMARMEQSHGKNDQAVDLATAIETAQAKEIKTMRALLEDR